MTNWANPRFAYGDTVKIVPNDRVEARVVDLHFIGQMGTVEYSVRYFHNGEAKTVRVFEDELQQKGEGDVQNDKGA